MKATRRRGMARNMGAFALGATAGSALALLFAPASGQVTRRRIAQRVRTLERSAARQLRQTGRVLAHKADDLREAAAGKLGETRQWLVRQVAHSNGNGHRRLARHRAAA